MQLITGGMGFVGLHTASALRDLGEPCIITQYRVSRVPDFIREEIGKSILVEHLDATDRAALLEIGRRHAITGIVHLAASSLWSSNLLEDFRTNVAQLSNILEAAQAWKVRRVAIASTIGVYGGAHMDGGPLREDLPLPMLPFHPIPASKKVAELMGALIAGWAGFEAVFFRFGTWGPLSHHAPSRLNVANQIVRAAVSARSLDFSQPSSRAFADDGYDYAYVRDLGRAIALLQLTPKLNHATYNIGTGSAVSYRQLVEAVTRIIPDAGFDLPAGFDPKGPGKVWELDITRLKEDTGFSPVWDLDRAVADYVAWLRAGNPE